MNPVIESKQIKINLLEEEDNQLMGESFLIRQALSNIIHNAIDFTPPKGHITIRVAPGEVSVQDNGPGIPQYALSRVFERFYSLQRPDSGRKSSGLGLSIVQRVTELHGGSASLTNGPEGGALAVVTFQKLSRRTRPLNFSEDLVIVRHIAKPAAQRRSIQAFLGAQAEITHGF